MNCSTTSWTRLSNHNSFGAKLRCFTRKAQPLAGGTALKNFFTSSGSASWFSSIYPSWSTVMRCGKVVSLMMFVALVGLENIPGLSSLVTKFEVVLGRGSIMNGREDSFIEAFGVFLEKPMLGHGIGQIDDAFGYAWLENSYILALVEGGIIGAVALFASFLIAIKDTVKAIKSKLNDNFYLLFAVYIQIMFVLMSMVENYFASPLTTFIFYLAFFASQKSLTVGSVEEAK